MTFPLRFGRCIVLVDTEAGRGYCEPMKRLLKWFRGLLPCDHECYLEDIIRDGDAVICRCIKCEQVLVGQYGLALPCSWLQKPTRK